MQNLKDGEDIDALVGSHDAVIIQFGTESCAPCAAIRAKIDRWAPSHPEVFMRYVALEEHPEAAAQSDVLSAPTLRLYVGGKLALEKAGYFSLEEFLEGTERLLSLARG